MHQQVEFWQKDLPISLVPPSKLREILNKVKTAIWKTNPDYDLVIYILHLYYDM